MENLPVARTPQAQDVERHLDRIVSVLHRGIDEIQFASALISAANELNPQKCSAVSTLIAAFNAARIGLMPGGQLGLCYFIPRKGKCNLEIGYQGYLDLAFGNEHLIRVYADVVLADEAEERFRFGVRDSVPFLDHTPRLDRDLKQCRKDVVAAYCVYTTKGGADSYRVLNRDQLDAVDSRKDVWQGNYYEMARKSAIRRAAKDWRKTPALALAMHLDDMAEAGRDQNYLDPDDDRTIEGTAFSLDDADSPAVDPAEGGGGNTNEEAAAEQQAVS